MHVKIWCKGEVRLILERLKLDDRHTITNPDGKTPPIRDGYFQVDSLGGGGFGVVVRVSDLLGMPRAAKILTNDVVLDPDANTNLFLREIELTNGQPYKHIVPIIFYDSVRAGANGYQYYVSQYVSGFTLRRFCEHVRDHRDDILATHRLSVALHDWVLSSIGDILSGVVELQASSVIHMDIKPDNILLHPQTPTKTGEYTGAQIVDLIQSGGTDAFLIDLGAGKPVMGTGRTTLRITPYFFPPIQDRLFLFHGKIDHEQLRDWSRVIDLYSVGRTLELMLLDRYARGPTAGFTVANDGMILEEQRKEAFWKVIFGSQMEVLEGLVDRLLMFDGGGFESAAEARFAFATIPLSGTRNVYDSDVLINRTSAASLPLGMTSSTTLGDKFQAIVDHPAFQRLRGIQQLAFVSEIYPDATHTRYTHSLRCYEMTRRALMSLSRRSAFRLMFDRGDIDTILAAALLHDIGQYHFSHSIEDLKKLGDLNKDSCLSQIEHDQERIEALCDIPDEDGVTIKDLLANCGISFADVRYITSKRVKDSTVAKLNIARDLISGMIDMDRVSYLIHDSERTGVTYGAAVNVPALLDALTLKYDRVAAMGDVGIGIEESGVAPAVMVLIAIYLMYREVYWHERNRAFMAAMKTCLLRLLRSGRLTFAQYVEATRDGNDATALSFVQQAYDAYLAAGSEGRRNPLTDLAALRGLGYEVVCGIRYEDSVGPRVPLGVGIDRVKRERELYARLARSASPDRLDALTEALAIRVRTQTGANVKDGDFLIDIPLKRRLGTDTLTEETVEEMGAAPRLWVSFRTPYSDDVEWRELRECSVVIQALERSEELDSRPVRVFASRHAIKALTVTDRSRLNALIQDALFELTVSWAGTEPTTDPGSSATGLAHISGSDTPVN